MNVILQVRSGPAREYADVLTQTALDALGALAPLDADRKAVMAARIARRSDRARNRRRIAFLDPDARIPRTSMTVSEARDGAFTGSEIPRDLQRQWIQGTGPAARPGASVDTSIRNVAYALLSGADGWMFDGEDALGQVEHDVAGQPAKPPPGHSSRSGVHEGGRADCRRDESLVAAGASNGRSSATGGRSSTSRRRYSALAAFTSTTGTSATPTAPDSRHPSSTPRSTSSTTISGLRQRDRRSCSICRRFRRRRKRRSGTTSLPRSKRISAWRSARSRCTCSWSRSKRAFQLMEIRAALGPRFVGFNTGRWDYINSVSDAMAWDPAVRQPEHRRHHDDLRLHAEL